MNKEGIIFTILFTFIVSFIFVAILALTNEFTRGKVERNQDLDKRRAVLGAFGVETTGTDEDYNLYDTRITERSENGSRLFEARSDGTLLEGIQFSGPGLWGTITGVIALNPQSERIVGLNIISHNETPGLGGRIAESWFKEQFRGEKLQDGGIQVFGTGEGDSDKDNGRVDAISGASRTSDAMEQILNEFLRILRSLSGAK